MRKYWGVLFGLIFCLVIITPVLAVDKVENQEIMSVKQVEKGMTGMGKTVVSGTEVEKFQVKVLGVLKKQGVDRDLILVKVSGDLIEKTGGIAAGMSGSPVYINGKLIGAIGYGWQLSDHKIGMVTPIKDMLDIWELDKIEDGSVAYLPSPIRVAGKSIDKVRFMKDKSKSGISSEDTLLAQPAQTPLLVSGLGKQALNYLDEELTDNNLKLIQAGGTVQNKKKSDDKLVPGSAIAVQLVRGDIDVSAIGTMTYKEGNRVLGFGHRFMAKGDSNYFLSSAYIHQMIQSLKMPFKLGSPLDLKGTVTQDRSAGIGGKLGTFPKVVPLQVTVKDQDLNRKQEIHVQLIRDEDLIQSLAGSVVYQAINSVIDRRGGGTAKVEMEIMANNLEENVIKRKNIFYSRGDVGSVALNDFLQGLNLVTQNPFRELNLIDIKLNVKVKEEPQVALIEEVDFAQQEVEPGEEIEFKVKLRPYRQEPITNKYSFKLPEDIEPGKVNVELVGGREAVLAPQQEAGSESKEYGHGKNETYKDLEEVINAFEEQRINSDLVLRIMPSYEGEAVPVSKEGKGKEQRRKKNQSPRPGHPEPEESPQVKNNEFETTFTTDYILEGMVDTEIKIKSLAGQEKEEQKN